MPLSWNEIKTRASAFSKRWDDAASEKSQATPFLIDFFEVFGITDKRVATYEHAVKKYGGKDGFIDLFLPNTLLIEMKSKGRDLNRAFDQAIDYFHGIKETDLPRYVLVCDFRRFRLYDLTSKTTTEFLLKELYQNVKLFAFVIGRQTLVIKPQDPINIKAAERMGKLHDALKAVGYTGHVLELYLVRLLFCLFAEDTTIFEKRLFQDYIETKTAEDGSDLALHIDALFDALNTPQDKRLKNQDESIAAFPYVNGKLFEERLRLAAFDSKMREALLDLCALDWSIISPAIFGSLFQSIMDADARRNLGAHYTSEENILKLIKPLFLDALWAEFEKIKGNKNRLQEFHNKLRSLNFLDPACGCGNFLVITYRELRLLEIEILRTIYKVGESSKFIGADVAVIIDVDQFYGIEIEEFPAQIAQVALWLTDHQMNMKISEEFGNYFARIPLKATPHIVCGNALQLNWQDVMPPAQCSFVLGNPPFLGKQQQNENQKSDFELVFHDLHGAGVLDFVACWHKKATDYMQQNKAIKTAFVSTNSITQGEQVGVLWAYMLSQGIKIHFAHRTFSWSNEARGKAAVHCVIVGFGLHDVTNKMIYEYADIKGEPHEIKANNINPYLVDAPDVIIASNRQPICNVPPIVFGSMPNDGGHLLLDENEKNGLLTACPQAEKWIKPFLGAEEFINNKRRYCLWLVGCPPDELRKMPSVLARVEAVKAHREASNRPTTQQLALTPTLFGEIRQPKTAYLLFPSVSSEKRPFIPIGFLSENTIASNATLVVPNATMFTFGVMTSTMHMAWVRAVCGRLKSDFRYSAGIVYNNFPWPATGLKHSSAGLQSNNHAAVEACAQAVLDARAEHANASLADLYDPLTMPANLLKAHQALDKAVDAAYGYKGAATDAARVAFLFERYQQLTSLLPSLEKPKKVRKKT